MYNKTSSTAQGGVGQDQDQERGRFQHGSLSQKSKDALHIPRYVRVNEHKSTVENMIKAFEKEGYTFVDTPEDLRTLGTKSFCKDAHLNDVLVFPPKTDLHIHPKYVAGDIILQDKASCFPAHVAQIPTNVHAIDACAAPGNKTSHLSALMKNTGRIWAFDLDQRRLQTLKKLTTKAGCRNIEAIHGSFLDADPMDAMYAKVEYLLLDPSCSGSGIVSRLDHLVDGDDDEQENADGTVTTREERLQNLSDFQISIIEHALKFPNAKRIVYSTCSIHSEENEKVVQTILSRHPEFVLASRESVLPTWQRRGFPGEMENCQEQSDSVVRTLPSEDLTNGFFVACFVPRTATSLSSKMSTSIAAVPSVSAQPKTLQGSTSQSPTPSTKRSRAESENQMPRQSSDSNNNNNNNNNKDDGNGSKKKKKRNNKKRPVTT